MRLKGDTHKRFITVTKNKDLEMHLQQLKMIHDQLQERFEEKPTPCVHLAIEKLEDAIYWLEKDEIERKDKEADHHMTGINPS